MAHYWIAFAETRKTYRAILSEPQLILPPGFGAADAEDNSVLIEKLRQTEQSSSIDKTHGKKRTREEQNSTSDEISQGGVTDRASIADRDGDRKKKKGKGVGGQRC